ncbi:hypothetical protein [Ralstonia sp.]|uniref:hypothetical protein n=1 Tax=Ralstonia sp. TaxID=54061 RepID=UPI0031D0BB41
MRLLRESELAVHALSHPWVKDLYLRFAMWLHQRRPASPSLLSTFMSHHSFFERIDAQFVELGDFTAVETLSVFRPSELRKHLLVMHFLDETLGLTLTEQDKAEAADRARVAAKIADCSRHPWGPTIKDYASMLEQSGVAMRTRRMYISAAEAFCNSVAFSHDAPWTEQDAQRFLKKKPGNRANLTRFFSFCRQAYGWNVAVPPSKIASELPRTVSQLKKLLREIKAKGVASASTETLAKVIAKSFGFHVGTIQSLSPERLRETAGTLFLEVDGQAIDVPEQLEEIARAYFSRLAL